MRDRLDIKNRYCLGLTARKSSERVGDLRLGEQREGEEGS
jgi:hypothetical protein